MHPILTSGQGGLPRSVSNIEIAVFTFIFHSHARGLFLLGLVIFLYTREMLSTGDRPTIGAL
jgi:hypothetical protein